MPVNAAAAVMAALRERDDGALLLRVAADHRDPVHLVGGAVRDLLLGQEPRELDLVVEGEPQELLLALGAAEAVVHDRFGTATAAVAGGRIDVARARRERYPAPGALPEVEAAPIDEDLLRRDFSVNAMALALGGPDVGLLRQAPGALEDLQQRQLRVLHDASFRDDPTRLLRLGRYAARLSFQIAPGTAALATAAITAASLDTVSGARIGAELRLALSEPEPLAALEELQRLGVLAALDPSLHVDPALARRALELLPSDGQRGVLLLAAAAVDAEPGALRSWLDELEFPARDREGVVAAATQARGLAAALAAESRPSGVRAALRGQPAEAVALAGGLDAAPAAVGNARAWLMDWRHVRLEIDGGDLIAAGIPEGPEVGRRLDHTLALKLDGGLTGGREAELAAALAG